jgi:hypothetical protein
MKCSVDGCYAKTFRRGCCRNHFYMWDAVLTKGSGLTERSPSDVRPAPPSRPHRREYRVTEKRSCRCEDSNPTVLAWFSRRVLDVAPQPGSIVECGSCGMPIEEWLDVAR